MAAGVTAEEALTITMEVPATMETAIMDTIMEAAMGMEITTQPCYSALPMAGLSVSISLL